MSVPVRALRSSHDLLASLAASLDEAGATRMSYCSDWTVAQVFSHLGSGAEINMEWLKGAREHTAPIGQDAMQAIWDRWNARSPQEQVVEAVKADARLVEAYEGMSAEELAAAHIKLFGMIELDGAGLALFRLPEHAVHTWDIAVALDPSARVASYAVDLLIDLLAGRTGWMAKPSGATWSVRVETTDPTRTFALAASPESVTLTNNDGSEQPHGVVRMPAEALLRLAFGRLDDSNSDGVDVSAAKVTLSDLRAVFPGF